MTSSSEEFDAFYAARAAGLTRSLYAKTGDLERAHDCAQEAFARAWARWSKLDSDDPVAWVRAVAWRLAVSDWRARIRDRAKAPLVAQDTERPSSTIDDDLIMVRDAIGRLREEQQTVIVLHYFEDLKVEAISELTGIAVNTVKSHLRRGRLALRDMLDVEEPDPQFNQDLKDAR